MRALLASLVLVVMVVAGPALLLVLAARQGHFNGRGPQLAWHGDQPTVVRLASVDDAAR